MALPSPIAVDDTAGGTEILPAVNDGYDMIVIRNQSDTHAIHYSLLGEAPVEDACLQLAANTELRIFDAKQTGIGRKTSVKAIAPAGQTVNVYVEAIRS